MDGNAEMMAGYESYESIRFFHPVNEVDLGDTKAIHTQILKQGLPVPTGFLGFPLGRPR